MADELDVSKILQRAVQANARFYKGFLELSLEYVRGISDILSEPETATPEGDGLVETGAGALVLEGEAGSTVRGAFLVTNDLGRNVSCEFVISEFADPDGATVHAKAAFEPSHLDLEPGAQQVVRAMIPVDSKLAAGVAYTGEVAIKGLDGFTIPVVLRRLHRIEDSPAEPGPADGSPTAAKPYVRPAASSKAAPKRTGGKKLPQARKTKKRAPRAKKTARPSR
jgi:hypothetical protein